MRIHENTIQGNTVFVPGATSGIGLALALELQAKGNTVIVGGRRTELLDQLAPSTRASARWSSTSPTPRASRPPQRRSSPPTPTSTS